LGSYYPSYPGPYKPHPPQGRRNWDVTRRRRVSRRRRRIIVCGGPVEGEREEVGR